MNPTKAVCWGASGHARSVVNALRSYPDIKIVGYLDDVNPDRHGQSFEGEKILGGEEYLEILAEQGVAACVLGFGHCLRRIEVGQLLAQKGFALPCVLHPSALIASDAVIGEGTVVLAGALIDPGCRIGNYAIINNGAIVNHECVIGDGVHVCPGVNIAGRTTIGRGCWLGIGSTFVDKIRVGDHTFIGAGSVVTKDIPSGCLVYGNPARVIRPIDRNF